MNSKSYDNVDELIKYLLSGKCVINTQTEKEATEFIHVMRDKFDMGWDDRSYDTYYHVNYDKTYYTFILGSNSMDARSIDNLSPHGISKVQIIPYSQVRDLFINGKSSINKFNISHLLGSTNYKFQYKFLAWHKNNKRMCMPTSDLVSERKWLDYMFYTNFNDSEGNEIYTGHIITFKEVVEKINYDYVRENMAVVCFDKGKITLKYYKYNKNSIVKQMEDECWDEFIKVFNNCKVVGNVYENPELLDYVEFDVNNGDNNDKLVDNNVKEKEMY